MAVNPLVALAVVESAKGIGNTLISSVFGRSKRRKQKKVIRRQQQLDRLRQLFNAQEFERRQAQAELEEKIAERQLQRARQIAKLREDLQRRQIEQRRKQLLDRLGAIRQAQEVQFGRLRSGLGARGTLASTEALRQQQQLAQAAQLQEADVQRALIALEQQKELLDRLAKAREAGFNEAEIQRKFGIALRKERLPLQRAILEAGGRLASAKRKLERLNVRLSEPGRVLGRQLLQAGVNIGGAALGSSLMGGGGGNQSFFGQKGAERFDIESFKSRPGGFASFQQQIQNLPPGQAPLNLPAPKPFGG